MLPDAALGKGGHALVSVLGMLRGAAACTTIGFVPEAQAVRVEAASSSGRVRLYISDHFLFDRGEVHVVRLLDLGQLAFDLGSVLGVLPGLGHSGPDRGGVCVGYGAKAGFV